MTKGMEKLYDLVEQTICVEEGQQEKLRALSKAKLAVLKEIELSEKDEKVELLDVLASLDGQTQELREKALFQEALALGIELGRLRPSRSY